jgi:SAM-dependent methyltransferase
MYQEDIEDIDKKNANFWNELCGSGLAKSLGITEITPESLQSFDKAYFDIYPYLSQYVLNEDLSGKKVLEIGLGYGTLGQLLASRECNYFGLDIAPNAVEMMRYRLAQLGQNNEQNVQVGSALEIPHEAESFDYVYSIGCLHHTGNLAKGISEVYRVLAPGGKAIIMLYHKNSFRQLVQVPWQRIRSFSSVSPQGGVYHSFAQFVRSLYDTNSKGEAAPHTDYVSRREVRQLFKKFSKLRIDTQNFDTYVLFNGKRVIHREQLLNNIARILGLDLYIVATK